MYSSGSYPTNDPNTNRAIEMTVALANDVHHQIRQLDARVQGLKVGIAQAFPTLAPALVPTTPQGIFGGLPQPLGSFAPNAFPSPFTAPGLSYPQPFAVPQAPSSIYASPFPSIPFANVPPLYGSAFPGVNLPPFGSGAPFRPWY